MARKKNPVANKRANTVIAPCACVSAYQDKRYGDHRRVHNAAFGNGGKTVGRYRCTVCDTTRTVL